MLIKSLSKILFVLIILGFIVSLRLFVYDIYRIPSNSMSPTLISGDYLLVSKLTYGPRILNLWTLLISSNAEYYWFDGLNKVKKNDVVVFNYPLYKNLADSSKFIYGTVLIKRCFALPGDTVIIRTNSFVKKDDHDDNELFPYDSTLHWTPDNYGPLYVPGKGDMIKVTSQNLKRYKDIILYENQVVRIDDDSLLIRGNNRKEYHFKYDYFFFLGDNFYQSGDSRYWGLLPETHLIGKAILILFSVDQNATILKKIRWNRFFQKIENNNTYVQN